MKEHPAITELAITREQRRIECLAQGASPEQLAAEMERVRFEDERRMLAEIMAATSRVARRVGIDLVLRCRTRDVAEWTRWDDWTDTIVASERVLDLTQQVIEEMRTTIEGRHR